MWGKRLAENMRLLWTLAVPILMLLGLLAPLLEATQGPTSQPLLFCLGFCESNSDGISNLSFKECARCCSQYWGYSHKQARPVCSLPSGTCFVVWELDKQANKQNNIRFSLHVLIQGIKVRPGTD